MADDAPLRDPLADLRERVRETRAAAERLADEAATARAAHERGADPGPGWRTAGERAQSGEQLAALADLLRTLGTLLPEELREQLAELARQVLLLLRELVDRLAEWLTPPAAPPGPVEPVPVR